MDEDTREEKVPGESLRLSAKHLWGVTLVVATVLAVGGIFVAGSPTIPKEIRTAHLGAAIASAVLGLAIAVIGYKYWSALDFLGERWKESDRDLKTSRENRMLDAKALEQCHNFIREFRPSQGAVEELLTLAAVRVKEACERARQLYVDGIPGYIFTEDPGTDVVRAKAAFSEAQAAHHEAVREAVLRFGRLWDLVRSQEYKVKKCWPEYVGLSSGPEETEVERKARKDFEESYGNGLRGPGAP